VTPAVTAYFFDTSALVKRYHEEPGTERVDAIIEDGDTEIIVSSLLIVETASAFRRKYNRNEISEVELNESIGVFFREALDAFVIVPLEESLLTFSFDLILEDDLRTLDSLPTPLADRKGEAGSACPEEASTGLNERSE
jgi:predicted nucleic acid-binding protein